MAEPNPSTNNTGAPSGSSGAPPNIQKLVASKRLQQAQAQVGEVVDIMRVNVEKVLERDSKISELDRRADDLQEGASQFQQQAVKLKRKFWWENLKMWIVIGVVVLVVIVIVVVSTTGGATSPPAGSGEVVSGAVNSVVAPAANPADAAATPALPPLGGQMAPGGNPAQGPVTA